MGFRRVVHLSLAGLVWGVVALLLGYDGFGDEIYIGFMLAPTLGVAIGWPMQPLFESRHGFPRAAVALATLVLGTLLFGIVVGIAMAILDGRGLGDSARIGVIVALYGVFATGFVLALWPLAYLTHWVIEQAED